MMYYLYVFWKSTFFEYRDYASRLFVGMKCHVLYNRSITAFDFQLVKCVYINIYGNIVDGIYEYTLHKLGVTIRWIKYVKRTFGMAMYLFRIVEYGLVRDKTKKIPTKPTKYFHVIKNTIKLMIWVQCI